MELKIYTNPQSCIKDPQYKPDTDVLVAGCVGSQLAGIFIEKNEATTSKKNIVAFETTPNIIFDSLSASVKNVYYFRRVDATDYEGNSKNHKIFSFKNITTQQNSKGDRLIGHAAYMVPQSTAQKIAVCVNQFTKDSFQKKLYLIAENITIDGINFPKLIFFRKQTTDDFFVNPSCYNFDLMNKIANFRLGDPQALQRSYFDAFNTDTPLLITEKKCLNLFQLKLRRQKRMDLLLMQRINHLKPRRHKRMDLLLVQRINHLKHRRQKRISI